MITTKCSKCIFANNGNCSIDVPNRMIELYPDIYNNTNFKLDRKNNLVITNFKCPYARTKDWLKIITDQKLDPITSVEKEISIKYHLVMIMNKNTYLNFKTNMDAIFSSHNKPAFISLVLRNFEQKDVDSIVYSIDNEYSPRIAWKLYNIIDDQLTTSEAIDLAIDSNLEANSSNILCVMNNDYVVSDNFFDAANNIFNYLLNKKVAIIPKNLFMFHNIMIPSILVSAMYKKIGLVLEYLETTTDHIYKFSIE